MDISDIRRANLIKLAAAYPTKTAFALAAGLDVALLYKILHGQKNLGNTLAKRVEQTLNLTSGSLSQPETVQNVHKSEIIPPHQEDPQTALVALLKTARLAQGDAQSLLHICTRLLIDDSSSTP